MAGAAYRGSCQAEVLLEASSGQPATESANQSGTLRLTAFCSTGPHEPVKQAGVDAAVAAAVGEKSEAPSDNIGKALSKITGQAVGRPAVLLDVPSHGMGTSLRPWSGQSLEVCHGPGTEGYATGGTARLGERLDAICQAYDARDEEDRYDLLCYFDRSSQVNR